jgi:hypothetical protein
MPTKEQDISLSWHLTTREKQSVYNSVYLPENVESFKTLLKVMNDLDSKSPVLLAEDTDSVKTTVKSKMLN